jgi:hypothetical protein
VIVYCAEEIENDNLFFKMQIANDGEFKVEKKREKPKFPLRFIGFFDKIGKKHKIHFVGVSFMLKTAGIREVGLERHCVPFGSLQNSSMLEMHTSRPKTQ